MTTAKKQVKKDNTCSSIKLIIIIQLGISVLVQCSLWFVAVVVYEQNRFSEID